jgi:hypothetical protein
LLLYISETEQVCVHSDAPTKSSIEIKSKTDFTSAASSLANAPKTTVKNLPKMSLCIPSQKEKQPQRLSEQPAKTNPVPSLSKLSPLKQTTLKPAFAKPSLPLKSSNQSSKPDLEAKTHLIPTGAPKLSAFLENSSVSRISTASTFSTTAEVKIKT